MNHLENMKSGSDITHASARDLHRLYATKQLSPVEVIIDTLKRAKDLNPAINAFTYLDEDSALEAARTSEMRWLQDKPLGPLDGVPVSIKDNLQTAGWPTRMGSKTISPDQAWITDAPAVVQMREAGGIIFGKTTTSEFCTKAVGYNTLEGALRNPWDITKTSGGSSAGAASATAAGIAPVAIGTDGGGSIRIPSSFCGVYGFKPTFGRTSQYPYHPFSQYTTVGVITNSVYDAASVMNYLSKPDKRDCLAYPFDGRDYTKGLVTSLTGKRIAYCPNFNGITAAPEVAAMVQKGLSVFQELGAEICEIELNTPFSFEMFEKHYGDTIRFLLQNIPAAARSQMDEWFDHITAGIDTVSANDVRTMELERLNLGSYMQDVLSQHDFLITPTVPCTAFAPEKHWPEPEETWAKARWMSYAYPFNLTRQPAASLPCGFSSEGLPVGLQIVSALHSDAELLAASYAYETQQPWQSRRPQISTAKPKENP